LLLGLALLLLFTVATIAACGGGASFEGTWYKPGDEAVMVITKADDGYDVVFKAKQSDTTAVMTLKATENGDALEIKDPSGASKDVITMTVSGDKLTMKSGTQTETLTRADGEVPAVSSPSPSAS
jgi:hypothetical protein